MSERGRGEAAGRRRAWITGLVAGLIAAGAAFAAIDPAALPPGWVVRLLPGVTGEVEVVGGAEIEIEVRGPGGREALARRIAPLGRLDGNRLALADVEPEDAEAWVRDLLRPGRLELKEVVEGSELFARLHALVAGGDARAVELGVRADIDQWVHDGTARHFTDSTLEAPDRATLEAYLEEVARRDSALAPEPGLEIAFEQREDTGRDGAWRSYLLRSAAELDSRHIDHAEVYQDEYSGQPGVMATLTGEGEQRFAELTGRLTGRKLAILVDGEVLSAPVIQERIPGGRFSIHMGTGDPQTLAREARTLAAVLGSDPLPEGVEVIPGAARPLAPAVSAADLELARALLALLIGLAFGLSLWLLERRAGRICPSVSRAPGAPPSPWIPTVVTLAGVAAAAASSFVPLPGVDLDMFDRTWADGGPYGSLSLFALGLMPFFTAFILVELAALAVPRWRPLRTGRLGGRARLGIAAAALGLVLAAVQAWLAARWLADVAQGPFSIVDGVLVAEDAFSLGRTALLLFAGASALGLLALVLDRYALGNGFALVLLGGLATDAYQLVRWLWNEQSPLAERLALAVGVGLVAVLTSGVLRWRGRGESAAARIRLPTAGIVPLGLAPIAAVLLAIWRPEGVPLGWLETLPGAIAGPVVLQLGLLVGLSVGLSWLFSRPQTLGQATSRDRAARRGQLAGFARATLLSTGYLAALLLLERLLGRWATHMAVPVAAAAVTTAILMDLLAEWRARWRRGDLVPLWPLHQVQEVDLVVDALTRAGIDVHTRGLYLRSLLHFFGPFVPVVLQVPGSRRDEAARLVRSQLHLAGPAGGPGAEPEVADADDQTPG